MLPDNIPPTLGPAYSVVEHNQPITLYKGCLEISQRGVVVKGNGTACFAWFPYPQVKFELTDHNPSSEVDPGEASLSFPELGASASALISRANIIFPGRSKRNQISGHLVEPVVIGSGQDLAYVQFHLTNFHNFCGGKVAFEARDWKITINQLETTGKSVESLKSQGGYAITHVGKIEQSSGEAFEANEECNKFLEGLAGFLSFVRGFRISPLLLVGYGKSDNRVWQKWNPADADSFRKVRSWFPTRDAQELAEVFPGFMNWWQDWGESAELALHWYLESDAKAGAVEGAIILEQTALELLAWVLFVEKECIVSKEGFDKLPASDRLRLLLSRFGISSDVPSSLTELTQFMKDKQNNWVDGPHALTDIRNGLIHPKKRQRILKSSPLARIEARELSRWYLELALLRLSNYQGTYFNNLLKREVDYSEKVEQVPWAKN